MNKLFLLIGIALSIRAGGQSLKYYPHIESIVIRKCANCHQKDGGAPFLLDNYPDLVKRKQMLFAVIQSGYMPPWTADPHYRSFANENLLTQGERDSLLLWLKTGASKGKTSKAIIKAKAEEIRTAPDLELSMKTPYHIPGDGKHHYICYKIPYELPGDAFVKAVLYKAGNTALVHHASYQIFGLPEGVDPTRGPDYYEFSADSIERVDDERDFKFFGLIDSLGNVPFPVFHSGFLPGNGIQQYPEGIGFALPRKGVLLIRSLHYSPTPIEAVDQSKLQLWFADQPITRKLEFAAFKPRLAGDTIPADSIRTYSINIRTKGDMSLLHINPHMHQLGRSFKAWALTPFGDTIPLVYIPKWDFNWQEFYRFKRMLKIPGGSIIHAEAVYDNTKNNPNNPNNPPKSMLFETGSMDDTTEMMRLVFLYVPFWEGDEDLSLE